MWRSIRPESAGSAQKRPTSPTFSKPTKLRGTRCMRPAYASAAADQSPLSLRRITTKVALNGPAQPAAPNISSATAATFGKTPSLRAGRAPNANARPVILQSASHSMSRTRGNSPTCAGSRSASAAQTAGPWQASLIGKLGTAPHISFSTMLEGDRAMQQSEDPRWQRFGKLAWECLSRRLTHAGLFDLACDNPDFWQGSTDKRPNSAVLGADNVVTEDFCIIDGQNFVRCVLKLPLLGCPARRSASAFRRRCQKRISHSTARISTAASEGRWDHGSAGSRTA
jgi:hypothetical protein